MTERKIQALSEKVIKEKEEYIKEILSLSKEEILNKAYEITVIEEFFLWFTEGGINNLIDYTETKGQIFEVLENTPNLLRTLQQRELKCDIPMSHNWDDIEVFIKDFVDDEKENYNNSRKETYKELISMGYKPEEAWEQISKMDFAEDYNN